MTYEITGAYQHVCFTHSKISKSICFSSADKGKLKKSDHLPRYLRWPHMHANQVHGLSLREIGGGFAKHSRAPSIRAACYAIAKPSTMVQKMPVIKKLRGHQNAVYCGIQLFFLRQ